MCLLGIVVGAITVIGGIGGTVLGSKIVNYTNKYIKNSNYFIPAIFTIPGSICVLIVLNLSNNFALIVVLLLIGEICIWIYIAPISAISITCIPPPLRSRSAG